MSHLATEERLGWLPLQQHGHKIEGLALDFRHVLYGTRTTVRRTTPGAEATYLMDPRATGDVVCWAHWHTADEAHRPTGAWAAAWPSALEARDKALPLFDKSLEVDHRFAPAPVSLVAPQAPGTVGITLSLVREDRQDLVFLPADGRLVAHWRGPDVPTYSTLVADISAEGAIDATRAARLDTAWRVSGTVPDSSSIVGPVPQALAWALTTDRGAGGWGLVAGRTVSRSGGIPLASLGRAPLVLACMSAEKGGPLHPGAPKDRHALGANADGEPINAGHLWTGAPYFWDAEHDGPLAFSIEGAGGGMRTPFKTRVVFGWNGAEWDWHSYSLFDAPSGGGGEPRGREKRPPERPKQPPPPERPKQPPPGNPAARPNPQPTGGPGAVLGVRGAECPHEITVPGISMRPQKAWVPGRDYRYAAEGVPMEAVRKAPITFRAEAYGAEARVCDWQRTMTRGGERYEGRTGPGGLAILPPERGIENVRVGAVAAGLGAASAITSVAFVSGVVTAWCDAIDTSRGWPDTGWACQAAGGDLTWYSLAGTVPTAQLRFNADGTVAHYAGLRLPQRVVVGADATLSQADFMVCVDSTGAARNANLPQAAGVPGQLLVVKKVVTAAGAVTVNCAVGDTIDGGGAVVLGAVGDVVRLQSDGGTNWWTL